MEKIGWTDQVKNRGEILRRNEVERSSLLTIEWRKAICIGHILHRNSLLKHVEGKR